MASGGVLMALKALGVGLMLLVSFPASTETLCVSGAVYIEEGQIVPPSKVVARNVKNSADCPTGSVAYVQHPDKRGLSSSEIKRLREKSQKAEGVT
jgi:hypothetical protein